MTQKIINIGSAPNDGTGDPLRTAFSKANDNFTELYNVAQPGGSNRQIQYNDSGTFGGAAGTSWDAGKQQLSLTALPGDGTNAGKSTALTINSANAPFDVGLTINKPANSYSGLDISADAPSGTTGQFLRLWTNVGGTWAAPTYFDASGALNTRTGVLISGTFVSTTPNPGEAQTIAWPSADPLMCGIWMDVFGVGLQIRGPQPDMTGGYLFSGLSGLGDYVFSVECDGAIGWGAYSRIGSTKRSDMDTWLRRGNAPATLQLGGADAFTPVAQTLTAQNAVSPISDKASTAAAAGTNTIQLQGYGPLAPDALPWLPKEIVAGVTVTNSTTPGSIPAGTTVASVDSARQLVTLSNNIAAPGVSAGDVIVFSAPNVAGADLSIAGSRGTGTGAGGALHFKVAPAGAYGAGQNPLVDALVIDSAKTATFSGKAVVAAGAVGAPSLTFSGLANGYGFCTFDAANIAFTNGTAALWSFQPSGLTFSSSAFGLQWAVGAPGGTLDLGLTRASAGVLEVNNGSTGTLRDVTLRNIVGQTGYHELIESIAPTTPSANRVRIYAEDDGTGKTRLMALFATGVAQQIAIQP